MSYTLVKRGHRCDVPDSRTVTPGTVVRCDECGWRWKAIPSADPIYRQWRPVPWWRVLLLGSRDYASHDRRDRSPEQQARVGVPWSCEHVFTGTEPNGRVWCYDCRTYVSDVSEEQT